MGGLADSPVPAEEAEAVADLPVDRQQRLSLVIAGDGPRPCPLRPPPSLPRSEHLPPPHPAAEVWGRAFLSVPADQVSGVLLISSGISPGTSRIHLYF